MAEHDVIGEHCLRSGSVEICSANATGAYLQQQSRRIRYWAGTLSQHDFAVFCQNDCFHRRSSLPVGCRSPPEAARQDQGGVTIAREPCSSRWSRPPVGYDSASRREQEAPARISAPGADNSDLGAGNLAVTPLPAELNHSLVKKAVALGSTPGELPTKCVQRQFTAECNAAGVGQEVTGLSDPAEAELLKPAQSN